MEIEQLREQRLLCGLSNFNIIQKQNLGYEENIKRTEAVHMRFVNSLLGVTLQERIHV
jgi:dolichyl-phosphate-mannose--protein O-mannosyl transferase